MSRYVRFHDGDRPSTYLNWHRQATPDHCGCIDLDAVEYCRLCDQPLALVETAVGLDQLNKTATITKRLASLAAGLPSWILLYTESQYASRCNPRAECTDPACDHGIAAMKVRMIRPVEKVWQDCSPGEWATHIMRLHDSHQESVCQADIGSTSPRTEVVQAADLATSRYQPSGDVYREALDRRDGREYTGGPVSWGGI